MRQRGALKYQDTISGGQCREAMLSEPRARVTKRKLEQR